MKDRIVLNSIEEYGADFFVFWGFETGRVDFETCEETDITYTKSTLYDIIFDF